MTNPTAEVGVPRAEDAVAYFLVYLLSLFVTLEGELGHWLTLVLLHSSINWIPAIRFLGQL
jgi:hypothetical protein